MPHRTVSTENFKKIEEVDDIKLEPLVTYLLQKQCEVQLLAADLEALKREKPTTSLQRQKSESKKSNYKLYKSA